VRRRRRQFLIRAVERVGIFLVLLDVALYFALLRPVENLAATEHERFTAARRHIREAQARVERLEKFQEALPGAGDKIATFKRDHVPSRRQGYSQAARLLRRVTEESGIHLTNVAYRPPESHGELLERLGIEVSVEGSFSGLLKFAHALETASDFILIREFNFEPGDRGALALRVVGDLYLKP
jgi:Tfp pilus assembly protein PilO